jgi:hypothetical protein
VLPTATEETEHPLGTPRLHRNHVMRRKRLEKQAPLPGDQDAATRSDVIRGKVLS